MHRLRLIAEQLWLPVVLLLVWWFASASSTSLYLPPLAKIWGALLRAVGDGTLWTNLGYSLGNLGLGLLIGCCIGIVLGCAIGEAELLREALNPVLQFWRSIPMSAVIPVVVGLLGIGTQPKVFMIAFAVVWPVLLNTIDGVRSISPQTRDLVKAYRIPAFLGFLRVTLPAASPQIVAGVRIALSVGITVMVVSEFFASTTGLGFFILRSSNGFDLASTWAGTLVAGLLGYAISLAFGLIERAALRWYFDSAASADEGRRPSTRGTLTTRSIRTIRGRASA